MPRRGARAAETAVNGVRRGRSAGRAARSRRGVVVWRAAARAPEQPALAVAGAQRPGDTQLLLGLDALSQEDRAGALGLGVDGVDDRGDRR